MDDRVDLPGAVSHFWRTRLKQRDTDHDGNPEGDNRAAAVGGKQLDGLTALVRQELRVAGVPDELIVDRGRANITLPGYFRPAKQWDLLVVQQRRLLAAVELKSLCGPSFGNNFNNRIEEALGCCFDFWRAYRAGLLAPSPPPFLGYLLLLEDAPESRQIVSINSRQFAADEPFAKASYARRSEIALNRLVDEQLLTAACLILSPRDQGPTGKFHQPLPEMQFQRFVASLAHHVTSHLV